MRFRSWQGGAGAIAAALLTMLDVHVLVAQPKPLAPKDGMICLLVNRNSGRCLTVAGGSVEPGAKIVQGPTPDQAGAAERWVLLGTNKGFRLRNHASRLVLEIGGANVAPGVQAIQGQDQVTATHQHWLFEPVENGYLLRAGHSSLVLSIGEGSRDPGGRAVQLDLVPGAPEECWELRPAFQEYSWSFAGNPDTDDFKWMGPDAEHCVKLEPAGLRITLPLGFAGKRLGTGISKHLGFEGDFDVTIGFQILAEAPADTGLVTGLFVGVDLETRRNRAVLTRGVRKETMITSWLELTKTGEDEPFKKHYRTFPTTLKAGRLRLTRTGAELLYEVAAPESNYFTIQDRHEFSEEGVKYFRICGTTGGPKSSLDARVIDLSIRAKALPIAAPPDFAPDRPGAAPPAIAPQATGRRGWLAALLLIGLAVVLLVGLAVAALFYVRQRRAAPTRVPAAKSKR